MNIEISYKTAGRLAIIVPFVIILFITFGCASRGNVSEDRDGVSTFIQQSEGAWTSMNNRFSYGCKRIDISHELKSDGTIDPVKFMATLDDEEAACTADIETIDNIREPRVTSNDSRYKDVSAIMEEAHMHLRFAAHEKEQAVVNYMDDSKFKAAIDSMNNEISSYNDCTKKLGAIYGFEVRAVPAYR